MSQYWPITQALLAVQQRVAQASGQAINRMHVPAHAGHSISQWNGITGYSSVLPPSLFALDNTELDELDTLGEPQGCIAESQALAAELFGAEKTFYLINGASVGLMAALLALPQSPGEQTHVMVARNCHRSVINGLVLAGQMPVWVNVDYDEQFGLYKSLGLQHVQQQFETSVAAGNTPKALILTHPTYEGVVSELEEISAFCKQHKIVLIVDEAHASLWPLSEQLPLSGLQVGVDAVLHSLHKSMGALTQTALLHLPTGSLLNAEKIQQALNVLQTSSPSFVLLASIEECLSFWASKQGRQFLEHHLRRIAALKNNLMALKNIQILPNGDKTLQLVITSTGFKQGQLAERLEYEYGFACEADYDHTVLLELNPGLPDEAFAGIEKALHQLDTEAETTPLDSILRVRQPQWEQVLTPREAFLAPACKVEIEQTIVAPYPPGIAQCVPGQRKQ